MTQQVGRYEIGRTESAAPQKLGRVEIGRIERSAPQKLGRVEIGRIENAEVIMYVAKTTLGNIPGGS